MQDFRNLKVWQKSHQLTLQVYQTTSKFPRSEEFGLTSQMRRAAASIPTNIAEGCGRGGQQEFRRFLRIASGSASEIEYQLLLSRDLALLDAAEYEQMSALIVEIKRMLTTLIQKLSTDNRTEN